MVIEGFKDGNATPVGNRFRQYGRMLPAGVVYHASWVDPVHARCFQIMEAPHRELLNQWISAWEDLVNFEIVPVVTSHECWGKFLKSV
jgi:Protein of unknown function (DUF3303)